MNFEKFQKIFTGDHLRWLTAVLIIFGVSTLLFFKYPGSPSTLEKGPPSDFQIVLNAVQVISSPHSANNNPYQAGIHQNAEENPYKFSPGVLAMSSLLLPLQGIDTPRDAWFGYGVLSICIFALLMIFGLRYPHWRSIVLLVLGLIASWKGLVECIDTGQVEISIFGIATLAALTLLRVPLFSGFVLAYLPWIKLPWLFLLIPFLVAVSRKNPTETPKPPLRRLKHFFSGFVLGSVFWGAAVPAIAYGPDRALLLSQQWFKVLKTQPWTLFYLKANQSLWMLPMRWWPSNPEAAFALAALMVAVLLALLMRRRPISPAGHEPLVWLTPWLIFTQLISPLAWRWGSVFLVGIFVSMERAAAQDREGVISKWIWSLRSFLAGVAFCLFLLQQTPVVQQLGFHHWTDLHRHALITLYWLVMLVLCI